MPSLAAKKNSTERLKEGSLESSRCSVIRRHFSKCPCSGVGPLYRFSSELCWFLCGPTFCIGVSDWRRDDWCSFSHGISCTDLEFLGHHNVAFFNSGAVISDFDSPICAPTLCMGGARNVRVLFRGNDSGCCE